MPLYGLHFELDLGDFGVEIRDFTATSIRGAAVTDYKQDGNKITFALDKTDAYEVIVIGR